LGFGIVLFVCTALAAQSLKPISLSEAELSIWNTPAFQRALIESYQAETEIEPRVTQNERADMLGILELIGENKMAEAVKQLQKQVANEACSAVFDFTLANIYFQGEELEQAAQVYAVAVKKYPKVRRAWKNLALIHVRLGQFEEALPALTKVMTLGGADALTYGLLGFAYLSVGNPLCAESAYRMAMLMDPETLDWKMGLARSCFKQQRYAEAVALCDLLIRDDPDRAELWLLQANAYLGLNQPMKAAVNFEMVDQLGASTAASLNMLGDIYVNQEIYDTAVSYYARGLDKDASGSPNRVIRAAQALTMRGALEQSKRLLECIRTAYDKTLSTEHQKDLLKLQARIAVAQGAGEDEVKILQEIVKLDPLDGEALILLGQHAARQGDIEQAVFYYERAESLEAHEADAKVRHAQLLVGRGQYREALPLLRRAQDLKPRPDVQTYLEQVERVAKTN
jgi:tetratricopeptide (TPR) repeat protein